MCIRDSVRLDNRHPPDVRAVDERQGRRDLEDAEDADELRARIVPEPADEQQRKEQPEQIERRK